MAIVTLGIGRRGEGEEIEDAAPSASDAIRDAVQLISDGDLEAAAEALEAAIDLKLMGV